MLNGLQAKLARGGDDALLMFYSPPAEEPGVAHQTKADAEAAEG
jgi:hypothetical protein